MKRWVVYGLFWGIFMFSIQIIWPFLDCAKTTLKSVCIGLPIWLLSGLIFGWTMRKNFSL